MALLTIQGLMDDVLDEIPNKEQAPIVRACNKVIRRIYTEFVEPARGTFTTLPKVTTGTVAVTQDSASVTFSSSVLSASDPLRLVQIQGDSAWFNLTRVSGTAGTISSAWAQATNATATFTIMYPCITFPSGVGEILRIWCDNQLPLTFSLDERERGVPWQMAVGIPTNWSPYTHDETGSPDDLRRILLSPGPQDRKVFQYSYKPRVSMLSQGGATSQTIPLPDIWYEAVVAGTLFFLWKQDGDDNKAMLQSQVYEAALARARAASLPAASVPRRSRSGGKYTYERRPVG